MTADYLLAHLTGRFKAGRELIATEALCYLAEKYQPVRDALGRFLQNAELSPSRVQELRFRCEVALPTHSGRVDIVGEAAGLPMLMIEGKFEAGLTEHQPNGYLEGLPQGGTLLFLCPGYRVSNLTGQLAALIPAERRAELFKPDTATGAQWLELDQARHLAVVGWLDLIAAVRAQPGSEEPGLEGELRQLEGVVRVFESSLEALTRDELTRGIGDCFTKGVVATHGVVHALKARGEVSAVQAARWKTDGELNGFYYGSDFKAGGTTVYVGFEPTSWGPDSPSPVSFWIMRDDMGAERHSAVYAAYCRIVEAFNTQFCRLFDGLQFHAREQDCKWWWAPIPTPPDASQQECMAVVAASIATLVGELSAVQEG